MLIDSQIVCILPLDGVATSKKIGKGDTILTDWVERGWRKSMRCSGKSEYSL